MKENAEAQTEIDWALVAHVCNPSYSGGRDQEDRTVQSQSQVKSL
jgi:hypothetical protein